MNSDIAEINLLYSFSSEVIMHISISTLYKIKTIPSSQLKLINATKQLE